MSVLTDIKKLAGRSRLFVDADKLGKPDPSRKHSKKRSRLDSVKIGQGGTLDPLANGVLGMSWLVMYMYRTTSTINFSRWCRKGDKASFPIFRLHQGLTSFIRLSHKTYRFTGILHNMFARM